MKELIRDILKEEINQIIKESSKQERFYSLVNKIGIKNAVDAVGGIDQFISITDGSKDLTVKYLLSFFNDIVIEKYGRLISMSENYVTFMEKPFSSLLGSVINVYDNQLSRILHSIPEIIYERYRKDLIIALIEKYPEFSDTDTVYVHADRGMYRQLDKFELNDSEIIEEGNSRKDRIIDMLHDVGYITTIQSLGGYENFKRIVGDDYLNKERKIELIGDITHQFGRRGELNLYDFDVHIMINKDEYDDGSFDATYVHYVEETGNFFYRTYSFDEEGWMEDNEIDEGYSPMSDLSEDDIDLILDDLIDTFL
jgi:hypothetical protein